MKKSEEDFKKAVKEKNIKKWLFRSCSICGVDIGYYFKGNKVFFDGNCNCVRYSSSSYYDVGYKSVVGYYNSQDNEDVIKEMDAFWGFDIEDRKPEMVFYALQFLDSKNMLLYSNTEDELDKKIMSSFLKRRELLHGKNEQYTLDDYMEGKNKVRLIVEIIN